MQQHHYPPAWLPNRHGFKFIAVLRNGTRTAASVVCDDATGLYRVAGIAWADLVGWVHA